MSSQDTPQDNNKNRMSSLPELENALEGKQNDLALIKQQFRRPLFSVHFIKATWLAACAPVRITHKRNLLGRLPLPLWSMQ